MDQKTEEPPQSAERAESANLKKNLNAVRDFVFGCKEYNFKTKICLIESSLKSNL